MASPKEWQEHWRLEPGQTLTEAQARERLNYCLEWRPWLWRKPALKLLTPFSQFRGKRVLEIGARYGRMSCLMAACGAEVLGVDVDVRAVPVAKEEAQRWGVQERTSFEAYSGGFVDLPAGPFDIVFTKSVLVILRLDEMKSMLGELKNRMATGGEGLFLENASHWLIDKYRRRVLHVKSPAMSYSNFGFYPHDLAKFEEVFGTFEYHRHMSLVWSIRARRADGVPTSSSASAAGIQVR